MNQPFGQKLVAGDTWKWTVTLDDYPSSQFTLKYFFRGVDQLDAVATGSGNDYTISIPPTATGTNPQTGKLNPGQYLWQMCVFDASNNRTELDRGSVEVLADISQAGSDGASVEGRSFVKQALDNVRQAILNYSGRVEQEYQIGNRIVRCKSLRDLLELEGILQWRYKRELIESGQLPPATNDVRASFGDPGGVVIQRFFPGSSA
jgi:hypothetical protein